MSSIQGTNQGPGEVTNTGSNSNKIKEAYHVVHGIGENVRGNMMNVLDTSQNQRTSNEERVQKGKMEAQQGMSALRGKIGGTSNAGSTVHKANDGNLAAGVPPGRIEQTNAETAGTRHHRDDVATDLKAASQAPRDGGNGPVSLGHANVPHSDQNIAPQTGVNAAGVNAAPNSGDNSVSPLGRQSNTMSSDGAPEALGRRDEDPKSGDIAGRFARVDNTSGRPGTDAEFNRQGERQGNLYSHNPSLQAYENPEVKGAGATHRV